MGLFRSTPSLDPALELVKALDPILERLARLEESQKTLTLNFAVVTANIDAQADKVHRELGHVTRHKRDIKAAQPCDEEAESAPNIRPRFAGGRHS